MAVKERLGHSSITVTMDRYGHLFPAVESELAEGLNSTWLDLDPGIIRARPDVAVLETGSKTARIPAVAGILRGRAERI